MTATSISVLLGMADLAAEYGNALVMQIHNQRVADAAAYAGALFYSSVGTTTAMQSAGSAVAALNGAAGNGTTISLTNSPRGDGSSAVEASISSTDVILMSRRGLTITGQSYVALLGSDPPCILALSTSGTGVTLSGGTKITATGCAVASNSSVTVPCGTDIVADVVDWYSVAPSVGCSGGISAQSKPSVAIKQVKTADPLATNSAVSTDTARLSTVAAMAAPAAPSVPSGTALTFGYSAGTSMTTGNACSATHAAYGANWTVTCPANGTYNFGAMNVSGGITVSFDTSGSGSTYNFSGAITNQGSSLTFGSGTFNIAGGLVSSSSTTFGSGSFNIGQLASSCSDGGYYSICNTSTLTIAGPAVMTLQAGLYNGGGETVSIGAGSSNNSYKFGPSSNGYAISVGGGSQTTLGDATGGLFQAVGNILASGGECITLPAAGQHDIYGNIATAGGITMGAGIYTVTGYVDIGGNGGGDVTCGGQTVGVSAANTTLVIGAAHTPSDNCAGMAFCVGAGFGHVSITAPASGSNANLAVIGPTGGITAGANFTDGASSTVLSGAFYFPDGAISMGGAASISSGNQCLELIGTQISLGGGSAAASTCAGLAGNATSTTATLVQ